MHNKSAIKDDYLKLLKKEKLESPKKRPSTKEVIEIMHERIRTENEINKSNATLLIKYFEKYYNEESDPNFHEYQFDTYIDKYAHEVLPFFDGITNLNNIYFNEFPTNDFNANIKPTKNGYLCLLNTGLLRLIYGLTFAICYPLKGSTIISENKKNQISHKLDIKFNKPRNDLFEESYEHVFSRIIHYIRYQSVEPQKAYKKEINLSTYNFLNNITYSIKCFIVSHEIAHLSLGHLNNSKTQWMSTPHGKISVIQTTHQNEYDADEIAQKILFKIEEENEGFYEGSIISGALCFFYIQLIFESICEKESNSQYYYGKHPRTIKRLEKIKQLIKQKRFTGNRILIKNNIKKIDEYFSDYYNKINNFELNETIGN